MKKLVFILAFVCCFVAVGLGADQSDGQKPSKEMQRVDALNEMSEDILFVDSQKARSYAEQALELAEEEEYTRGIAEASDRIAAVCRNTGEYSKAIDYSKRAAELFTAQKDSKRAGKAFVNVSNALMSTGAYPEALDYGLKALSLLEGGENEKTLASALNNLGEIYRLQEDYEEALSYYNRSLVIAEEFDNKNGIARCLNNISLVYQKQERYQDALEILFRALDIVTKENIPFGIGRISTNIGFIYKNMGNHDLALEYFFKSLAVKSELRDRAGMAYTLNDIGETYGFKGQLKKGIQYSSQALDSARAVNATYLLKDINKTLSHLYKESGQNEKAYYHLLEFMMFKDSLFNEDRSKEIGRLEMEFELSKKEVENELLKKNSEVQEQTIKEAKLVAFSVVLGLLLVIIVAMLVYRNYRIKKRVFRTIEEKNDILAEQNEKLEDLHREQSSLLSTVVHDLNTPLHQVKGLAHLISLSGPINDDQRLQLSKIDAVIDKGHQLIGDLLAANSLEHEMYEVNPELFNLNELLDQIVQDFQQAARHKSIRLEWAIASKEVFLYTDKKHVTRIFENLLSNALKFSPEGKSVELSMLKEETFAAVAVKDAGPGIREADKSRMFKKFQKLSARPTGGEASTGLGLFIVKQLVDAMQGEIHVRSEVGKGTEFKVRLPLRHE